MINCIYLPVKRECKNTFELFFLYVLYEAPSSLVATATQTIMMANEKMSEFYESVCSENQIKINPHILEVLEKSTIKT